MVDPCTYSYIGSGAWCSLNDNRAKSSPIYRPIFSKGNKNISVSLCEHVQTFAMFYLEKLVFAAYISRIFPHNA